MSQRPLNKADVRTVIVGHIRSAFTLTEMLIAIAVLLVVILVRFDIGHAVQERHS